MKQKRDDLYLEVRSPLLRQIVNGFYIQRDSRNDEKNCNDKASTVEKRDQFMEDQEENCRIPPSHVRDSSGIFRSKELHYYQMCV